MSLSITESNSSDLALIAKGGEAFQKRLKQLEAAKAEAEQALQDARAAHDAVRITEAEREALKREWEEIERTREDRQRKWNEFEEYRAVWVEYIDGVKRAWEDCKVELAAIDAGEQRIKGQA